MLATWIFTVKGLLLFLCLNYDLVRKHAKGFLEKLAGKQNNQPPTPNILLLSKTSLLVCALIFIFIFLMHAAVF